MHIHQPITEAVVRDYINHSVGDVFQTMLRKMAVLVRGTEKSADVPWPPLHPGKEGAKPHVVGTIGFQGELNGVVYLYFDLEFAHKCTSQLLGMNAKEVESHGEEVVNDAVAELTNMCVGGFKNRLCDAGYPCMLTIPSIVRGTNFCVEPANAARRHIYHFDCSGHRLVADIHIKDSD